MTDGMGSGTGPGPGFPSQGGPTAGGGDQAGGGTSKRNLALVVAVTVVAVLALVVYVLATGGHPADKDLGSEDGGVPLGAALNTTTTAPPGSITSTTDGAAGGALAWHPLDDPDGHLAAEFPCAPMEDVATIQHISERVGIALQGKEWSCKFEDSDYVALYVFIPSGHSFDPEAATYGAADAVSASITSSSDVTVAGLPGRMSLLSRSTLRFRVAYGANGRVIVGVTAGPGYDTPTWDHFLGSVQYG